MRFILLDKVTELLEGQRIEAVKSLSLAEEYLADHFPAFPVMPGVLMIEGLVQTAAMLVRKTLGFSKSMIVLQEAKNVKYKSFVKPGNLLRMVVEAKEITPDQSRFNAAAYLGEQQMVEAKLKLKHFNLADENPELTQIDEKLIENMKRRAELVGIQ